MHITYLKLTGLYLAKYKGRSLSVDYTIQGAIVQALHIININNQKN